MIALLVCDFDFAYLQALPIDKQHLIERRHLADGKIQDHEPAGGIVSRHDANRDILRRDDQLRLGFRLLGLARGGCGDGS